MDPIISKYEYCKLEELNWCKKECIAYQRDMSKSVKYDDNYLLLTPNNVLEEYKGYFEDRRPASNCDPYLVTSLIMTTTL